MAIVEPSNDLPSLEEAENVVDAAAMGQGYAIKRAIVPRSILASEL